jgi:hypothetical protein
MSPTTVDHLTIGSHRFSVIATDLVGNVGGPVSVEWTVVSPTSSVYLPQVTGTSTPVIGGRIPSAPTPRSPAQATVDPISNVTGAAIPTLASLRLNRTRFRPTSSGSSILTRSGSGGTVVSYSSAGAATTRFIVERLTRLRPVSYRPVGSFVHHEVARTTRFVFSGRLHGRRLPRGQYRLSATARASDGAYGPPLRAVFRIT